MIKEFLEDLLRQEAPGPGISFTVFDLIRVLERIAEEEPIGRGRLARELGIGDGAIRTLIRRLRRSGLISTSKAGCSLTEEGKNIWKRIHKIIPYKIRLDKSELSLGEFNIAILVRGMGFKVKNGLEQRDAAVSAGAKGAVTLIFKRGRFILPPISNDADRDFPDITRQISRLMELRDGDVIIIGGADNPRSAEYGALAAAWTLL